MHHREEIASPDAKRTESHYKSFNTCHQLTLKELLEVKGSNWLNGWVTSERPFLKLWGSGGFKGTVSLSSGSLNLRNNQTLSGCLLFRLVHELLSLLARSDLGGEESEHTILLSWVDFRSPGKHLFIDQLWESTACRTQSMSWCYITLFFLPTQTLSSRIMISSSNNGRGSTTTNSINNNVYWALSVSQDLF